MYRRFSHRQGVGHTAGFPTGRVWGRSGGGACRRFPNRQGVGPIAAGEGRTAGFPTGRGGAYRWLPNRLTVGPTGPGWREPPLAAT